MSCAFPCWSVGWSVGWLVGWLACHDKGREVTVFILLVRSVTSYFRTLMSVRGLVCLLVGLLFGEQAVLHVEFPKSAGVTLERGKILVWESVQSFSFLRCPFFVTSSPLLRNQDIPSPDGHYRSWTGLRSLV